MAIAPDDLQLKETDIALLPPPEQAEADESLWQTDRAKDATEEEQQSHKALRTAMRPNYGVIFWLVLLHVGALAAPFFFSWQAVVLKHYDMDR